MKSFSYDEVATDSLAPKKYGHSERSKLLLFDATKNCGIAQKLYTEAAASYKRLLTLLPATSVNQTKLEPSLKAQIVQQLQAIAQKLNEAAPWYQPAGEFLEQYIKTFAQQYDISLHTKSKLGQEDCIKEPFTTKAAKVTAHAATYGLYTLYSTE